MVLTIITIGVAFINLGAFNFPVAIAIAITKATLVILFFMHAKYSSRLTKLVIGGALFFVVTLLGLTMTDYLSRGWHASPRGSTTAGTQNRIGPAPETPAAGAEGAAPAAGTAAPAQEH
jgi:cytochrome c oxidase subunit 4